MAEAPATTTTETTPHWSTTLPPDQQGLPAVKEAPDLPTFVKRFGEQQAERSKIANEYKTFKDSVEQAGKLRPAAPADYKIAKPESLPEYAWSEKTVTAFRELAHAEGLSQATMEKLIAFDAQRFSEVEPVIAADKEAAKKAVTDEWQKEGKSYDDMMNLAVEGAKARLSAEEYHALEASGLINHAYVLSGLAKIGEVFQTDTGQTGGAVMNPDAKTEADEIVNNKNHPKHEAFWKGDKAVNDYVQDLYKKAYPGTYGG